LVLSALFFLGLKEFLPKKIFSDSKPSTKNILIDSMLIDAFDAEKDKKSVSISDTLENQPITFFQNNGVVFPEENFENYSGFQYLIPFYESLYQLENTKTGKVRIAYFGDSMTDGDYIVQDLRQSYQQKFGGQGVGFVSITSESAASRGSIIHEFSKNWKMQSYLNVKKPIRPFGVNGHVFFANDTINNPWIKFKAGNAKLVNKLFNATLFYGSSGNDFGEIKYVLGKDTISKQLTNRSVLNTIQLKNFDSKNLKVNFINTKNIPIYGFDFTSQNGIQVDNFSQRGMSGIPLSKFDISLMAAFQQKLHYDLIVLHYGTNVLNYGTKDYSWYEKSMTKTVNRLKQCFPGVAILIISTADKATKYDTTMQTDSAVVPLSQAQKRYAVKTQSGFINLYTLMGGNGSMTKWVETEPTFAGKDYTHFNLRGSKRVANLIFEDINKGFETYKKLRKNKNNTLPINNVEADSLMLKTEKDE
jgi:lysophospholipase L1-like esterase